MGADLWYNECKEKAKKTGICSVEITYIYEGLDLFIGSVLDYTYNYRFKDYLNIPGYAILEGAYTPNQTRRSAYFYRADELAYQWFLNGGYVDMITGYTYTNESAVGDKLKKRALIIVAVLCATSLVALLSVLYLNRTRPLSQICATEDWTDIMFIENWTRAGGESTPLMWDESCSPNLQALISDVEVKRILQTRQLPMPSVQIFVQTAHNNLCILCVGEDGVIVVSWQADGTMRRICYQTDSTDLYSNILGICGSEPGEDTLQIVAEEAAEMLVLEKDDVP